MCAVESRHHVGHLAATGGGDEVSGSGRHFNTCLTPVQCAHSLIYPFKSHARRREKGEREKKGNDRKRAEKRGEKGGGREKGE